MSLEKNLYFRNIFYFQLLLESPAESEYFIVKYTLFFSGKTEVFSSAGRGKQGPYLTPGIIPYV